MFNTDNIPIIGKPRPSPNAPAVHRRQASGLLKIDYLDPYEGDNPDNLADLAALADDALCRAIGEKLESWVETRGPLWKIVVSHEQGIVKIGIPALMRDQDCYCVHIAKLETDPGFKCIQRGCGELLERFNIPRSGLREQDIFDALARHPLGYRGLYRGESNPLAR